MEVVFWIIAVVVIGFIGYKIYQRFTTKTDSGSGTSTGGSGGGTQPNDGGAEK